MILAESDGKYLLEKGMYIVLHASAVEYKNDLQYGLYPVKGNWYYDSIKIAYYKNRYLRFIDGNMADKFYNIAKMLIDFNEMRNRHFANLVLGELLEKEILNVPHYGMPNINCVCIGAQWQNKKYTLLTAPEKDIYIIEPVSNKANQVKDLVLSPHGLGVRLKGDKLEVNNKNIILDGKRVQKKIDIGVDTLIRGSFESDLEIQNRITNTLKICNGKIYGKLKQVAYLNKNGFKILI